ncbi:MAG: hypothetical protein ACR2Q3_02315 [Woeseiaceae bacterium]
MTTWKEIGRQTITRIALWAPLRSYGELVLRPVTIAERAAGTQVAFCDTNNDKK